LPWGTPLAFQSGSAEHTAGVLWLVADGSLVPDGLRLMQQVLQEEILSMLVRLDMAKQLAKAVSALHEVGLCHGSLAGRSVFVAPGADGQELRRVRVADVGLVGALQHTGLLCANEHLSLGAAYTRYLAPEAWQGPCKPSEASDVWSLGLLVAECLGAGPPYAECRNMQRLSEKMLPLRAHDMARPRPLQRLPRDLHLMPRLATLLSACLRSLPGSRPRAWQLASALAVATSDAGGDHQDTEPELHSPVPSERSAASRPAVHRERGGPLHASGGVFQGRPSVKQLIQQFSGGSTASSASANQPAVHVRSLPGSSLTKEAGARREQSGDANNRTSARYRGKSDSQRWRMVSPPASSQQTRSADPNLLSRGRMRIRATPDEHGVSWV